ncbi:4112_t:CDS:1, partial [Gigaspora rosea]
HINQKKTNNLQNQHNKRFKKVNCSWRINLSATDMVRIASFNDHYIKHQLFPDTNIFVPANHQFSDNCHEEIHYLIVNSCCDLSTIWSLIFAKYPDQLFLTRNLANVVANYNKSIKWKE